MIGIVVKQINAHKFKKNKKDVFYINNQIYLLNVVETFSNLPNSNKFKTHLYLVFQIQIAKKLLSLTP